MIRKDKETGSIFGHTGLPDLVKMLKPYTSRMLITHLGSWFLKDTRKGEEAIRQMSDENLTVEPARDGQILRL